MSGVQNLTGIPWHVERFEREEGDERRHRSRCRFFQGKPYNLCLYHSVRCYGSAHCENYIEKYQAQEKPVQKLAIKKSKPSKSYKEAKAPATDNNQKKGFSGLKYLPLSAIHLDQRYAKNPPKPEKIARIIAFYEANHRFAIPMIVEPMRNQYRLIGNPLSFFAAQQLGLKSAPAETGTKEEIQVRKQLRTKGTLVWSNQQADVGEVIQFTLTRVTIQYDNGNVQTYDLYQCLEKGQIRIL